MLDKFIHFIKRYIGHSKEYYEKLNDLNRFNDEFAKKIDWTPMAKVGTQFCTRRLATLNHIVVFLPSISFLFFCALFIGVGGVLIRKFAHIHTPFSYYFTHLIQTLRLDFLQIISALNSDRWLGVVFVSLFFMFGLITLLFALKPIYFNVRNNYFMKGIHVLGADPISLHDIYALQMISNANCSDEYTNYELNLVLKNKERINIVCHSRHKIIRKQAKKLSEILSVPFWDKTSL